MQPLSILANGKGKLSSQSLHACHLSNEMSDGAHPFTLHMLVAAQAPQ